MLTKVDLHSHIRAGGGQKMADRYAELGFDVLVGTDHVQKPPTSNFTSDYSDLEFDGVILNGSQFSQGKHVSYVESENESLRQINHPMRYGLDAGEINRLAERIDADLVEVTEHAGKLDEYPTISDVVSDLKVKPSTTSDAHSVNSIGRGYIVVEIPELVGDEVIKNIKDGNYALYNSKF